MMDIRITHALPDDGPLSGPVKVGWLLSEERGGVIYDAPRRVRSVAPSRRHAKSASRCPAIIGLESRYFEVPCPFDLHLAFVQDKQGKPALRNVLGQKSSVRPKKLEALRMEASQMDRAAASPAARSMYLKSSKQRLYYSKRGKRGKTFLKEGDRGLEVERLQEALRTRNLYAGPANGRFSPKVTQAVKEFQKRRNLTPDGVAGPRTLRALGLY